MINEIINYPNQFVIAKNIFENTKLNFTQNINRIIFAGIGGSGLSGYVVKNLVKDYINLEIIQDYHLPSNIDENTLVILTSFSGNTEETLSCLDEALSKNTQIIIIANNGKLTDIANEKNINFLKLPDCLQPRLASGYNITFLIMILEKIFGINQIINAEEIKKHLDTNTEDIKQNSQNIAKKLINKLPIIYSSTNLLGVARSWKINFNENTKIQSFWNVFPELNHNEMVGFTKLNTNPCIIYLRNDLDHPRINQRMDIMKKLFENKIDFIEIELKGTNLIEKISYAMLSSYFTSYYLALEYNINPMPVEIVEDFKKALI